MEIKESVPSLVDIINMSMNVVSKLRNPFLIVHP